MNAPAGVLDQFYTRPELAAAYIAEVLDRWRDPEVLFVEPSAGAGAFCNRFWTQEGKCGPSI